MQSQMQSQPQLKPPSPLRRKRGRRFARVALVGAVVASTAMTMLPATPASAAIPPPKRIMSGWMPYWTTQESLNSFIANAGIFSDVSPFWHDTTRSAAFPSGIAITNNWLSYSNRPALMAKMRGRGAAIMPSITDGTGAYYMRAALRSPFRRAHFAVQITNLVVANRYDGIDLDFEKFAFSDAGSTWATTRPAWVAFIAMLGKLLHARGKKLSVAVPPMGVANGNYWVYDWPNIGPHIDKLRIMAYDYSWDTPGSVGGPLSWVESIGRYAKSVMPAKKIQMGAPTYGRDWVTGRRGTGCPSVRTEVYNSNQIGHIWGIPASRYRRDPASKELYLNYALRYNGGSCLVYRRLFIPDAVTIQYRALQAGVLRLNGIATWMVGTEQASQWQGLRTMSRLRPFSAPRGV